MEGCSYEYEGEFFIIYWISLSCSIMSIMGSLFIIICYLSLNKPAQGGQFRLIIYLTIADLIFSVQRIIVTSPCQLDIHDSRCITQSFLETFSSYSSLLWTLIFCVVLYRENKYQDEPFNLFGMRSQVCYIFWGFGLPFILSVVVLFTQAYGPLRYWCWVPVPGQRQEFHDQTFTIKENPVLQYFWIILFLVVLWAVIITELIIYCLIVRLFNIQLRKNLQSPKANRESMISQNRANLRKSARKRIEDLDIQHEQELKTSTLDKYTSDKALESSGISYQFNRQRWLETSFEHRSFIDSTISRKNPQKPSASPLFIYPIILLVLWLVPSINRIWTLFQPAQDYIALFIVQNVCLTMTGFVNALAYGLNSSVREELGLACRKCCAEEKKKKKNQQLQHSDIQSKTEKSFQEEMQHRPVVL